MKKLTGTNVKSIAACLAMLVTTAIPVNAQDILPGDGKMAQPARPNWDAFWFAQEIVDIGMERLGYDVKAPMTLAPAAIFVSLARNDVQYSVNTILPNHSAYFAKTKDDVLPVGPIMDPGTVQGYMVDKVTAEKYNIRYLEDLRDPEIAKLFDQDGDGKADMIGPSVGWKGSNSVATKQLKDLGLDDTVHMIQGEYNTLAADAVGRYSAGEPIFIYTWYPNPTTMKLKPGEDLVWLQLHDAALPEDQMSQYMPLANVDGCADDPCHIGWLPTVNYIAVNKEWAAENPAAMSFFNNFELVMKDMAEQNAKMLNGEGREEDIKRHAQLWIDANEADFDAWIEEAKAAGQ